MEVKGGGLPTLYSPSVVPQKWMTALEKKKIQTMSALDYIMEFCGDRFNKKAKNPGEKVLVLKSGTGSGKSTSIAPTLYEQYHDKIGRNIIITQPRVLTAIDIPNEIVKYYKSMKLDDTIGFQTGILKRKPVKGVVFSTVGVLLQQLKTMTPEEVMSKYSVIIIDEVHDRSIDVEGVLYYLKKILHELYDNERCPLVILMSATFDQTVFMKYFNTKNYIEVSGLTFPIEKHFAQFDQSNYINYAMNVVEKIHIENIEDCLGDDPNRDILIFVNGQKDIAELIKRLDKFNEVLNQDWGKVMKYQQDKTKKGGSIDHKKRYFIAPIPLNSDIYKRGDKDYQNLFTKQNELTIEFKGKKVNPVRKVIVATNIAETGVTIETLKYCIDTGYVTYAEFNPDFKSTVLYRGPVTKGMSDQRRGRVGRKAPGTWYSCYTEESYNKFLVDQYPNIITEDLTQTLLSVIVKETETTLEPTKSGSKKGFEFYSWDQSYMELEQKKIFNSAAIDFMEYPSASSLKYSFEKLYKLGFIDKNYNPTIFGYFGNLFRKISIESVRMILAGYTHKSSIMDLITIACFLQFKKMELFEKEYRSGGKDEMIEFVYIWNEFMAVMNKSIGGTKSIIQNLEKWCAKSGIKHEGLLKVAELRDEVIATMITMNLNPYYNGLGLKEGTYVLNDKEEVIKIKKCIYDGFRLNLAIWDDVPRAYVLQKNRQPLMLKPPDDKPRVIIVGDILVAKSKFNPDMFVYNGSIVSPMTDINIDEDF